jgi:prolyl 4-hydroxylase
MEKRAGHVYAPGRFAAPRSLLFTIGTAKADHHERARTLELPRCMSAAIALAAELDAAGRHDDAIDALARGTREGDLDATLALALRLLVGDRAPLLPQEAVRFLSEVMLAGRTEAALRLAALVALGAHVPQSWSDALGILAHAAERGDAAAQGQLRALAPAGVPAAGAEGWRRLAQSVDLRGWLAAPAGETLHERPVVRRVADLATGPVCDWLRRRAEGRLRRALIYDATQGGSVKDHMRSNSIVGFDLADIDCVQVLLQYRMAAACGLPVHHAEGPTILHYGVGEQITNHYDFLNPGIPNYAELVEREGERIVTFLLYLNDDYEGGETDFPELVVRHRGRKGGGLFWTNALPDGKPDERMVHAGLPPTRGEKWIVSQFFRSRVSLAARAENVG